ncbi:MaoC family dehydratase N-terminal domain-containing protein [Gordonia sp. zg691]|uniref:MaoC family dehydratase N-terminal domain-containing protein n=1 Tax=Gordonia jinghuaiqii TaxID=2758710 RepID=A0A7D7QMB9_9ACTN|nr:MaoC/PaaZ C-terminal domain-containing protein [Gordonia jinghuaiqii]MBD0862565.1 MaoC family dehydratase N-terminal domain-containing protein [Gordonia jinghuaiqii]MCR5976666.1 enoyl-CoA hydratase [Gordonia jinghuaiqii]QMS99845.1 MaoC family dehydratase N-terminal domain-containing protein [Gordonia jinghuaiqii]
MTDQTLVTPAAGAQSGATPAQPANTGEWRGVELGSRTVTYDERDAILYALAVGATATELDLVFEERLRVLPTFALTLAQWAPDELGSRGAFDPTTALHGSQHLTMFAPLPRRGEVTMSASVGEVWDKGSAAVLEVIVRSDYFVATWSLFAPGAGGYGGDRGPSKPAGPQGDPSATGRLRTTENQAALYRLTGDRHHIHIDPDAAARINQPRPIMHGLCTLGAAAVEVARLIGAHPADLRTLDGRFAATIFPGDHADLRVFGTGHAVAFELLDNDTPVISGGRAAFGDFEGQH